MLLNKYWQGIQEGDEKSLEALFNEINKSLCYYAYFLTEDNFSSEEIVQDVFLKIWVDRKKINLNGSLRSYLYKTVRNKAINLIVNRKTKKASVNRLVSQESWLNIADILDFDDFIIEKIDASETEEKINRSIEGLPEQCRKIFQLSRSDNKTNLEISSQLKISVSTVKTQIYRALEHIKKNLE